MTVTTALFQGYESSWNIGRSIPGDSLNICEQLKTAKNTL